MRAGVVRPPWGADELEKFVRSLRQPRMELERLDHQLRRAGWQDYELEALALANTKLCQVGELLLLTARNLRRRPPESGQ